jgi:hypothetical protein
MSHLDAGNNVLQAFRLIVDTSRLECNKPEKGNYISPEKSTSSDLTTEGDNTSAPPPKVYINHDYHDHSYERDPDETSSEEDLHNEASRASSGKRRKRKGPRGGVTVPFPEKLHKMLFNIEEDGHGHVISWQPHGRCFLVHKPKEFVKDIMPLYFKQTKLTSFQRQLNLYGFCRLTTGQDRGGYYHELFLKDRPFLCTRMIRTRVKGTGIKCVNNPSSEPNFYEMPFVRGLKDTPITPPLTGSYQEQDLDDEVESSLDEVDEAFVPPSFPSNLPLVMPVLPKSRSDVFELAASMRVVTPPSTPFQQVISLPPDNMPSAWLLEDEVDDDEMQITFEGRTFHYLDTSSFDGFGEERAYDLGFFAKKSFLADFDIL